MSDGEDAEEEEEKEYRQLRFTLPPGATDIFLVRHGESAPSRPGHTFPLVDGQSDPPLDPVGLEQAERVATRLAVEPITAIYVSTLQRTAQTAAPLAAALGLAPIVEPDLREAHLGEWESTYRQHVSEGHPLAVRMMAEQRWDVIPGAEPMEALAARLRGALTRIAARHPDEVVAVFSHGGAIGQLLADGTGSRLFAFLGSDNGAISQVVVIADRWVVRRYNDTSHLHPRFTLTSEPLT